MLDYIHHVLDIRLAILDGTKKAVGIITRDKQREIDQDTLDSFCNGLPSEILLRLKVEGFKDLEDAYVKAIKISEEMKTEKERYRFTPGSGH
ncbi:hypothetical protein KM043_018860, partial [Ampulex compressa]